MRQQSVVRIFATSQDPDYDNPWQAATPSRSTGSGVVIGSGQVLTGAHVVANATFVRVQHSSHPDKFVAKTIGVCHDSDLALLEVEDPRFMEDVRIAELGELPALRDNIAVVGFPIGGEEVSITEGVVSRVELQRYSHSGRILLAVTVDAAINNGNSGGPVFLDGKVVGIAFQSVENAENIGEMVPVPLIRRFLAGVDAGRDVALPGLGIRTQSLENPALRASVGLGEADSGVLVRTVGYGGSGHDKLEVGDALLEIDGYPIANNGTIQYDGRYRTGFDAVLSERFIGDPLSVTILRRGQRHELTLELAPLCDLVRGKQYDRPPTYFVHAGCVFQPLSVNFLATWREWWDSAPKEFLYHYYFGLPEEERREVVALTQVLADEINVSYENLYLESVKTVDGQRPIDMADFVRRVESARGMLTIEMSSGSRIVLDVDEAKQASERVLDRYQVRADRSVDLRA